MKILFSLSPPSFPDQSFFVFLAGNPEQQQFYKRVAHSFTFLGVLALRCYIPPSFSCQIS